MVIYSGQENTQVSTGAIQFVLAPGRRQLQRFEERDEPRHRRRHGGIAVLLVLLLGAIGGAAELHLLPTLSADDFGSIGKAG